MAEEYDNTPTPLDDTQTMPEDGDALNVASVRVSLEEIADGVGACAKLLHIGGVQDAGGNNAGVLEFSFATYAFVQARVATLTNATQAIPATADEYRIGQISGGDKTYTLPECDAGGQMLGRRLRITRAPYTDAEDDLAIIRGADGGSGYDLCTLQAGLGEASPYNGAWVELTMCTVAGPANQWVVSAWGGDVVFTLPDPFLIGGAP